MAAGPVNRVVHDIRRAALRAAGGPTDAELVEAIVRRRDEGAFEAIVRRHGAMVLGVCRRVLGNDADAEDAFQATFLVLFKRAPSIRKPSAASNWLYGVAHTTALKARAMNRKRRTRELEAGARPRHEACEEVWRAVQALLDAELAALPEKYRVPIVLCDLDGKTIREAVRQLGWPQGTVATRLSRGRALLARRLARHGLAVSAGTLVAALAYGSATAGVPSPLISATMQAAGLSAAAGAASAQVAALSQGVIRAMFLSKLKAYVVAAIALATLGVGLSSFGPGGAGRQLFTGAAAAQDGLPPGKQLTQPDLQKALDRLREELRATQLRLKRVEAENKVLKAQLELAQAQAEEARLSVKDGSSNVTGPVSQHSAKAELVKRADLAAKPPAAWAVSPDGRLRVVSQDGAVLLLEAKSGRVLLQAMGHKAPVTALAFSPDGKTVVSGSVDQTVRLWDVASGKQLRQVVTPAPVLHVQFTPDGRALLIFEVGGTVLQFDAATGKMLREEKKAPSP